MATKLGQKPETGVRHVPDSKRVKITNGQANAESGTLPVKTGDVKKE